MMRWNCTLTVLIVAGFFPRLYAQNCTNLGQNPSTAFPVCGTATFAQQTVPACGGRSIPVPGCGNDNAAYGDLNPFWYKFTCFSSGALGLTITPLTASDDYDWQLFDITGHSANDVYTHPDLYVASNWSANPGTTGTTGSATALTNCAGPAYSNKSKMPALIEGHQYLLLVSHFTTINQSGYNLSFEGGTASITDPTNPQLKEAKAYCDGTKIIVALNKKMRCNTLAEDGTDFSILNVNDATIVSASATGCLTGFDMDSLSLTLSGPLAVGDYFLAIKKGSDGNTLLDNCDRDISEGEKIPFSVHPVQPTSMDSLTTPGCAPAMLQLVFNKPIRCNSIASDGSDFTINGSSPVTIESASGSCNTNNVSSIIQVKLANPILRNGTFTIELKRGSDGNSIIDECGEETPPGVQLNFVTKDTVSAVFDYNILYGCKIDTILFSHSGGNQINAWNWTFEDQFSSKSQNLQRIYPVFGQKNARLMVTNGICSDTATADILLDNEMKADFVIPEFVCPNDTAIYKDASIGNIVSWDWNFGNGSSSNTQSPPAQQYRPEPTDHDYNVRLIVKNNHGCMDTATQKIKVVSNCYISIPSAFTPNGDNLNDFLYPINAYKANNLIFRVYNLYGQKIFETRDRLKKWDGTFNGKMQSAGTYVWTLQYTHSDSQRSFNMKGTTILIR